MKTVREILDQKGRDVHTIDASETVLQAIRMLADKGIGALVVQNDGKTVGLFSERDYTCKVVLTGKRSESTPVGDIMSQKLLVVHPDTSIQDCMVLMTERRGRHLPVVENDRLVGLVSIGDIVKDIKRCQPWRAKRRLVDPSSREAALLTRRAHSARGEAK
ncbi:CBS domain-containing protein [Thiolapillus sp.]|uniref:CBS domain-containing protein n=1 Tax=Thiolapillus sp. TaxID=2017437 RepID=UPI003AF82D16